MRKEDSTHLSIKPRRRDRKISRPLQCGQERLRGALICFSLGRSEVAENLRLNRGGPFDGEVNARSAHHSFHVVR